MSPTKTGGAPITDYVIEKFELVTIKSEEKGDINMKSKWILVDSVDRYTLDYKIKGLVIGGLYSIRVAAENMVGRSGYAEINEPLIARNRFSRPDAPIGPILITNITRETVDASWHAPKNNGGSPLLSYFIEKRDIADPIWIKVARIDSDIRSLKIINLVEGHEYEIRVSAENEYGQSEPLVSDKFKPLRKFGSSIKFFNQF